MTDAFVNACVGGVKSSKPSTCVFVYMCVHVCVFVSIPMCKCKCMCFVHLHVCVCVRVSGFESASMRACTVVCVFMR